MKKTTLLAGMLCLPFATGGCAALSSLEYALTGETTYTDMGPGAVAKAVDKECELSLPAIRKPFVDAVNDALEARGSGNRVYGFDCDENGDGIPDGAPDISPPTPS